MKNSLERPDIGYPTVWDRTPDQLTFYSVGQGNKPDLYMKVYCFFKNLWSSALLTVIKPNGTFFN